MRLLIEVEIPEEIGAREVMEEIDGSIDSLSLGRNLLNLGDSGTISNSNLKVYGNWKVVRP